MERVNLSIIQFHFFAAVSSLDFPPALSAPIATFLNDWHFFSAIFRSPLPFLPPPLPLLPAGKRTWNSWGLIYCRTTASAFLWCFLQEFLDFGRSAFFLFLISAFSDWICTFTFASRGPFWIWIRFDRELQWIVQSFVNRLAVKGSKQIKRFEAYYEKISDCCKGFLKKLVARACAKMEATYKRLFWNVVFWLFVLDWELLSNLSNEFLLTICNKALVLLKKFSKRHMQSRRNSRDTRGICWRQT